MGVLKEDRSGSTIKAVGDLDPIRMNQGEREKGGGRREEGGGRREGEKGGGRVPGGCSPQQAINKLLLHSHYTNRGRFHS